MAARDRITLNPTTCQWGGEVHASSLTSQTSPWLHAEVFQGDVLVYAQYVKGSNGTFTVGPTPAADETQPGTGRAEIGYWTKQGSYRATAVARFEVTA